MRKLLILTFCLIYSSLAMATNDSSLIAYFPFDGDAQDHSANAHITETRGGGLTYDKGVFGMSAFFDGIDDYIKIEPRVDVSAVGDFTISVWTLLRDWKNLDTESVDRQYIFDGHTHSETVSSDFRREGFFLVYDYYLTQPESGEIHNGILFDIVDQRNNLLEQAIPADVKGTWHHLAFVRRGGEDITYLDGRPLVSNYAYHSYDLSTLDMQHPWFIGTSQGNNPNYTWGVSNYSYYGHLDELKIWDRALSDGEIAQLSSRGGCPLISMSYNVECAGSTNWVRVNGEIESYDGEPLCAMVLSNGQHMFTCGSYLGRYDLTVPVDENGQITVFGFVDDYQPARKSLTTPD